MRVFSQPGKIPDAVRLATLEAEVAVLKEAVRELEASCEAQRAAIAALQREADGSRGRARTGTGPRRLHDTSS
jgi:multidrug resistance efflux pump